MVDADGCNLRLEPRDAKRLDDVGSQWLASLRAQAADIAGRVVTAECGEVHQRDRPKQPRRLPFLLDRAPGWDRRRATFGGASVNPDAQDPVEVQWLAGVS